MLARCVGRDVAAAIELCEPQRKEAVTSSGAMGELGWFLEVASKPVSRRSHLEALGIVGPVALGKRLSQNQAAHGFGFVAQV